MQRNYPHSTSITSAVQSNHSQISFNSVSETTFTRKRLEATTPSFFYKNFKSSSQTVYTLLLSLHKWPNKEQEKKTEVYKENTWKRVNYEALRCLAVISIDSFESFDFRSIQLFYLLLEMLLKFDDHGESLG